VIDSLGAGHRRD